MKILRDQLARVLSTFRKDLAQSEPAVRGARAKRLHGRGGRGRTRVSLEAHAHAPQLRLQPRVQFRLGLGTLQCSGGALTLELGALRGAGCE